MGVTMRGADGGGRQGGRARGIMMCIYIYIYMYIYIYIYTQYNMIYYNTIRYDII